MVVIDNKRMVVEDCGYFMGKPTQTPQKKVVSETKKTPEHSQEYYKAVAILEAQAEEKRLDEMGVPTVEELARTLGIPEGTLLRSSGQVNYQIESDPFSESHLPTEEEMLATFLKKDPVVKGAPNKSKDISSVESELDKIGEQMISELSR
jgi:hypothetical protein